MTNNHKPNQGNSQRRRASQPALPPVCTTPTAATTIVTIIIPASHQAAFPRSILQHQQQQMSPSISYEDPTPVMNSQVDVDVDMFQRMDIEDDQVPDMAPPLGFVDQFGQSIHQQQPVFMAPRVALSPSTVAFQALLSYPTVFDRPFDMTVGCPFNSTTAGNPSSAYQEAILSETAARLSNDQSDSRPRPLSQSEITPCLDQQQQQQQSDTTSSKPQATLSMYSYSTTSNSLSSGPFGQSGLDFGTTDPVSAIPSPSTASNERHSYISMGPSFSHLMYNSNSGFGYGSSLVSNSSSSAALAPAPAATTNTPAFGEPSFPASVTQVSTTIPSKPLAPTPPRFTLMSPSLSHTAAYFQYKQQRQQQEQSQAMCVDIPSSSSSVSLPNSNITVTSHSNTCRPSHDSVAFLSSIKEEHNYTRQELLRLIHRRRRAVQKRRRCMTDTDSGRETQYSDEAHCQNLPRAFESRRSSLRYSGGPRKDRKKAGRAVKELRSAKHLIVRKRKLSCELNEREYQVQMLCSSAPMVTPPSTPSAKDIRAYQEYRAFAASIDYSKIHHDPEEMRKYQKLERMECIFLRERRNPELARLEEIATTGVSSAENERTTILSSGLTPAEWLEAQGWIFSPSVDPLMVFTMQAPNELTGEDEESGVPIPAPSTVAPRNTVGTTSTTGASPTATSPLITPLYHSPSTNISTSSALPRTPRGSDASPPERQRTRFQSRRLELNEGSNQNREFKETGEARKQKEKVLKEERAQTEASRKARKAARQAQIQQEEDDEALAEEIRKQNERDRRGEINANEGLTPVEEESRQAWIKDQLEKKRTKEDQLDVEYQELLQQERHKEEAALRRLLERKRKEEVRREHKTRTIQVLSYEENTANTPSCKGKPATSGSAFISAFSSTTAETPVLTRTTSYATERDSTPGTDYIAPPDFDSSTTAISTTSSRAVHESSTPAQSSGQELPSVSLLEMSEAEQEFEEMNRWADQNVEYYDRITRERTSSPCNVPLESSQVPSLKSVGEQDPQDKSTTNSGQESRSAGMRRGTVDEKEYEGEEYEQQDIEYEQQQQDYKHRQQDDDNARKGLSKIASSGRDQRRYSVAALAIGG
ncbi:hypothetical protein BGZ47_008850 [Haplosporangium gracile]|nr:hypothetical protein BGZ47_008850 [Haplosporangium gracile]